MPSKKPRTNYSAEIKEAKKIAREAAVLGGKLMREAKASYDRTDSATKRKIKKAAVIGALSLVGLAGAKKVVKKCRSKR